MIIKKTLLSLCLTGILSSLAVSMDVENNKRKLHEGTETSENKRLRLDDSHTHEIEQQPQIIKINDENVKMTVTTLNLSYKELTTIPSEIWKLTNLTKLCLHNNQLSTLPSEIGKLTTLQHLSLLTNELTSLPSEIEKLSNLEHLYLSGNKLSTLPREIGKLTNLECLLVTDNQLTSFPPEIGNLTNLSTLTIRNNPLLGDEKQWDVFLRNNPSPCLIFYKTKQDVIDKYILLIAGSSENHENASLLSLLPKEIIRLISMTHYHHRLG